MTARHGGAALLADGARGAHGYHHVRRGGHGRRAETTVQLYWLVWCAAFMATAALMATTVCVGEADAAVTV